MRSFAGGWSPNSDHIGVQRVLHIHQAAGVQMVERGHHRRPGSRARALLRRRALGHRQRSDLPAFEHQRRYHIDDDLGPDGGRQRLERIAVAGERNGDHDDLAGLHRLLVHPALHIGLGAFARTFAAASCARSSERDPMMIEWPAAANRTARPRPSGPVPPTKASFSGGIASLLPGRRHYTEGPLRPKAVLSCS